MAVATLEQTQPSLLGKGDVLQILFGAAYHIPCHAFCWHQSNPQVNTSKKGQTKYESYIPRR